MKRRFTLTVALVAVVLTLAAAGGRAAGGWRVYKLTSPQQADDKYKARPGIYDPDNTGSVSAQWVSDIGLADDRGNGAFALYLVKAAPTGANSASGAVIDGVVGKTVSQLGFDVRDDSHCGAGAPRFNVFTDANAVHFFGCSYGTHTALPGGWTRVTFSPADGNPAMSPTEHVTYMEVVFDEGTDQGVGYSVLDNINVNGQYITKPGAAR